MRYYEFRIVESILLEYDRIKTAQKIGAKLLAAVERDIAFYNKIQRLEPEQQINAVLEQLEDMDPTPNKQFVQWLAKQYNNRQFRIEDAPRVKQILGYFIDRDVKRDFRRRDLSADINDYDYYTLRRKTVESAEGGIEQTPTNNASVDYEHKKDMRVLHASNLGKLIIPLSEPASCELGKNTEWCTAWDNDNQFKNYNKDGLLYVWIDGKTGEKFQFHFERDDFSDSDNRRITPEQMKYFREKNPITKQLFSTKEAEILKKNDPRAAYQYARNVIGDRWPEAEPVIATDPQWAYEYAANVINQGKRKGIRFPEGEPVIAKDPYWAYRYAAVVIGGRFPKGEPAIAEDPQWAYLYARNVINQGERKGIRWPKAEPVIATDPEWAYRYARGVIRDRWPKGEAAIAEDPQWAYLYARNVINQGEHKGIRWPEGEPDIAKDPLWAYEYARDVIRGRFPKGEPTIAKDPYWAYRYASDVIGGRWPEGEPVIAKDLLYKIEYERYFNVDLDRELRDK